MLGSVAKAAELVAPRNIRKVHPIPGVDAIPATGAGAATEKVFEGEAGGAPAGGKDRAKGGPAGGVGGMRMMSVSRDQVPLFRYFSATYIERHPLVCTRLTVPVQGGL